MGRWGRELNRMLRRPPPRRAPQQMRRKGRVSPLVVTLAVGIGLAAAAVGVLEARLRPMVAAAAQMQAHNHVTAVVEQAILSDLSQRQVGYSQLVTIQRDDGGGISSLTTDMAALNALRAQLVKQVLGAVEGINVSDLQIPLGSLINFDLLWARGPSLKVRAMTVGTVSAEFESEFSSAGVNQTLHRIWLEVNVPLKLLLPGGAVETAVETRLCVAETVIVGQVPETYLQLGAISTAP